MTLLSDPDVQMDRLGDRRDSPASEKVTRESSSEAPPERRRRRRRKGATMGRRRGRCVSRAEQQTVERVDPCAQIWTTTGQTW